MPLSETEIILCNTRHAGNIGAVARLMKNLDIGRLKLVNPTQKSSYLLYSDQKNSGYQIGLHKQIQGKMGHKPS